MSDQRSKRTLQENRPLSRAPHDAGVLQARIRALAGPEGAPRVSQAAVAPAWGQPGPAIASAPRPLTAILSSLRGNPAVGWVRDLTTDGDVEANPGPPHARGASSPHVDTTPGHQPSAAPFQDIVNYVAAWSLHHVCRRLAPDCLTARDRMGAGAWEAFWLLVSMDWAWLRLAIGDLQMREGWASAEETSPLATAFLRALQEVTDWMWTLGAHPLDTNLARQFPLLCCHHQEMEEASRLILGSLEVPLHQRWRAFFQVCGDRDLARHFWLGLMAANAPPAPAEQFWVPPRPTSSPPPVVFGRQPAVTAVLPASTRPIGVERPAAPPQRPPTSGPRSRARTLCRAVAAEGPRRPRAPTRVAVPPPQQAEWVPDLTRDGDVESNPGPLGVQDGSDSSSQHTEVVQGTGPAAYPYTLPPFSSCIAMLGHPPLQPPPFLPLTEAMVIPSWLLSLAAEGVPFDSREQVPLPTGEMVRPWFTGPSLPGLYGEEASAGGAASAQYLSPLIPDAPVDLGRWVARIDCASCFPPAWPRVPARDLPGWMWLVELAQCYCHGTQILLARDMETFAQYACTLDPLGEPRPSGGLEGHFRDRLKQAWVRIRDCVALVLCLWPTVDASLRVRQWLSTKWERLIQILDNLTSLGDLLQLRLPTVVNAVSFPECSTEPDLGLP